MRLSCGGPRGREGADGATGWSPAPAGDEGAAAGAESRALLELRWPALGGVPQPATTDAAGRGGPGHAGRSALSDAVLCTVSAGVSTRRGGRAGAAARRVRARRDRAGGAAPLPRASERAGDPPGAGSARRRARRADGRAPDRAVRGAGGAAADRPPAVAGPAHARGWRGPRARRHAAGRRPRGALGDPRLPDRRAVARPESAQRDRGRPGCPAARGERRAARPDPGRRFGWPDVDPERSGVALARDPASTLSLPLSPGGGPADLRGRSACQEGVEEDGARGPADRACGGGPRRSRGGGDARLLPGRPRG